MHDVSASGYEVSDEKLVSADAMYSLDTELSDTELIDSLVNLIPVHDAEFPNPLLALFILELGMNTSCLG